MNYNQGQRSELKRVGNPFHYKRRVKTEYYRNLKFVIDDVNVNIKVNVDTGSEYTVIRERNHYDTHIKKEGSMSIPKYYQMYKPFLGALLNGEEKTTEQMKNAVKEYFSITDEEASEMLPSITYLK